MRALAEPYFSHDFSQVRVHTDGEAARSAEAIDAHAYTFKQDIVFGAGRHAPQSREGAQLLAHELTHVIQQSRGAAATVQRRAPQLILDDPLEREADETSRDLSGQAHGGTLPYRQALETISPPLPVPPAAQVRDATPRVLEADRPRFNDLRTFVQGLPARLRALVARGERGEPWLTAHNVNVQSVLRVLDALVADLTTERFIVRFDQPAGKATASYEPVNNIMHLAPFSGSARRTSVAIDLVHEYTHILQDREAEAVLARQRAPHVHTREEDLQGEIDARRQQAYIAELLRVLGERRPTEEAFGAELSDRAFRGRFERERTAPAGRARASATSDIRSSIEGPYTAQLAANSSIKTYSVEIDQRNHALLHSDVPGSTGPQDLGEIPRAIADAAALRTHLEKLIRRRTDFTAMFRGAGGRTYRILTFSVVYDGRVVTELEIKSP